MIETDYNFIIFYYYYFFLLLLFLGWF